MESPHIHVSRLDGKPIEAVEIAATFPDATAYEGHNNRSGDSVCNPNKHLWLVAFSTAKARNQAAIAANAGLFIINKCDRH